jgi:hypothetical protein
MDPEETEQDEPEQTTPIGPSGSIWSNEPVASLQLPEEPVSQVTTPIMPQFTPTPPHPIAFDTESADEIDSESEDGESEDGESEDGESEDEDSEPLENTSIAAVDVVIKGDTDGMVSFGRWRHHKDAPLDLVKDMINRDLRESGPRALYGPGGLDVFDHPLVCYYNNRLQEVQQGEDYDASSAPQLSPLTTASWQGFECPLLRAPTPIHLNMDENGMFTMTGFHTRTASVSSTIQSGSLGDEADNSAGEQEVARRHSGAGGTLTVSRRVLTRVYNRNPGQVMRPYTPDYGLNIIGINNGTVLKYQRNLVGWTSEKYRIDFCGGEPGLVERSSPGVDTQLFTVHADIPRSEMVQQIENDQTSQQDGTPPGVDTHLPTVYADTPRPEMLPQVQTQNRAQQRGIPQQGGYAMQRMGRHVHTTEDCTQPQRPIQSEPQARRGQVVAGRHAQRGNFRLPGPNASQITHVSAEDADDAMWTDDESDDESTPKPQFGRCAVMLPTFTSLISEMVAESAHSSTPSSTDTVRPNENEAAEGANRSAYSSFDSNTAEPAAGVDIFTEPTASQITPGTTASSGGIIIKSPAHAESVARRLADHLELALSQQDETSQVSF